MPAASTLYNDAVKVGENYLGPAGERFIRRQISSHLDTEPEALKARDLPKLADWSGLAFALLTDDTDTVHDFKNDLLSLSVRSKR